MIGKLIEEGESLEYLIIGGEYGEKYIRGVEFEAWIAKCILYLEGNYPSSSLTEKAQGII